MCKIVLVAVFFIIAQIMISQCDFLISITQTNWREDNFYSPPTIFLCPSNTIFLSMSLSTQLAWLSMTLVPLIAGDAVLFYHKIILNGPM